MFLGLCDGHDSGAALVDRSGELVFAVSEERLSRRKRQSGFPHRALRLCLERADRVDAVSVAERTGRLPLRLLDPLYRRLEPDQDPTALRSRAVAALSIAASRRAPRADAAVAHAVLRRRLRASGVDAPLQLIDHHRCHARGAAAGRPDALVLTLDALGDGLLGAAWRAGPAGGLRRAASFDAPGGPALLYGQITALLGYGEGEEGKVVARASGGDPEACGELLGRALSWEAGRFGAPLPFGELTRAVRRCRPDDVAAALQARVERVVSEVVRDMLATHGGRRLALAGGLFANVALNHRLAQVAREAGLDEVWVFPAMGDSGLAAGAAWELAARAGVEPRGPVTLRLGPAPGRLTSASPRVVRGASAAAEVAAALRVGQPVASCRGPLEYGPRALGARSLLLSAADPDGAARLNAALGRDPVMPFGPITTAEAAPALLGELDDLTSTMARQMTVALPASPRMQALAPAAVHRDGTSRPQIIDRAADPALHDVLGCLPGEVCINTSLNLHHEPIVATADQAARCAGRAGAALLWLDDLPSA